MQWTVFFFSTAWAGYISGGQKPISLFSLMLFHACCIVSYVNGKRKHHSHGKRWT